MTDISSAIGKKYAGSLLQFCTWRGLANCMLVAKTNTPHVRGKKRRLVAPPIRTGCVWAIRKFSKL